jgi:hypothetical protein
MIHLCWNAPAQSVPAEHHGGRAMRRRLPRITDAERDAHRAFAATLGDRSGTIFRVPPGTISGV